MSRITGEIVGKTQTAEVIGPMETRRAVAKVHLGKILYATDFSRRSDAALPFALSIARRYGSKVFAAHVISLSPYTSGSLTMAGQSIAAQAAREARGAMAKLEPQLKEVAHETVIRKGDIWHELSAIVRQEAIDLIVVGTHGRTGVTKVLMGSVAENIFRHAPCPVLTVGPNVSGEPEAIVDTHTILFPTDFSPESVAAMPYAISLAQEHQARLYVLHVVSDTTENMSEAKRNTVLQSLIPPEADLMCEPRVFLEYGDPAKNILDLAEELAVDSIVLGVKPTPRLPGTLHLAMATAYRVVPEARCPVLTVRGRR